MSSLNSFQQSMASYGSLIAVGKYMFTNPNLTVDTETLPTYYGEDGQSIYDEGTGQYAKGVYVLDAEGNQTFYPEGHPNAGNPIMTLYVPSTEPPITQIEFPVDIPITAKQISMIFSNISPTPDLYDVETSYDGVNFTPLITINPQTGSTMTRSYQIEYDSWYTEMTDGLTRTAIGSFKVPSKVRVIQREEFNPSIESMTVSTYYQ